MTAPEWRALLIGGGVERIAFGVGALTAPGDAAAARTLIGLKLACQVGDGVALGPEIEQLGKLDSQTAGVGETAKKKLRAIA